LTNKNKAKDAIIEAASRLFRLHGYYGVGLSEIIKESGTAKGSLYYYFPEGKEELAIAAINHTKEFVSDKIREVTAGIEDPVQAIQAHIYQLSEEFSKESILGLPVGTIAGETSLTNESIRLACKSAFEDWQSLDLYLIVLFLLVGLFF
jgi:TetR/AcrR family transcriptional repressor of lmrAB and yxaGH operons